MDLLTVIVILLVLVWLTGAFVVPVGGSAIHLVLVIVIVIVVVVVRFLKGQSL